jgi:hypothetical protein
MNDNNNLEVLTTIVTALKGLDQDSQKRTLQAVITFLDIPWATQLMSSKSLENTNTPKHESSFSQDRDISAKDFLRDKLPRTDVERVACLAYYLTHYRSMQFFKTFDLSSLNTEAAQPKFSNPAMSVSNAIRSGFIVQAAKGSNQLSSAGEVFVQALPDRDAAKANLSNMRVRKRNKKILQKVK